MSEPDWGRLTHALGRADDLPGLLDELSPDPRSSIWGELWDRVYHQGNTYPASPYILPHLLRAANSWTPPGRVMPLVLASSIVASPEFRIAGFEATVAALGRLAHETVDAEIISRSDRAFVMGATLTLSGDRVWGLALAQLHDEEFSGRCPLCGGDLYFTIGELGCYTTGDLSQTGETRREEIAPREASSLTGTGEWLHAITQRAGDEELAHRVRCVFGSSTCTHCETPIEVAEAIERFQTTAI